MTSNTTNLGAQSPLPEGGKSLHIPERILSADSELLKLWQEAEDAGEWESSMPQLSAAIST